MKILVSACFLGENCKYSGGNNLSVEIRSLAKEHILLPVCPEVLGGLSVPRPPAEISGGSVITSSGTDVTEQFRLGAQKTLALALEHQVTVAILKERSPSCGSSLIYDGSFSGRVIDGAGITAALLKAHGILVLNENNFKSRFANKKGDPSV